MTTTTQKKRQLRYLNRDFESYKRDFIKHLQIYFPDTVQDFNESSVGMSLLELVSYIGDNLSFYMDRRFQEVFTETAREPKNIFKHAKQLGFKPFGKTAAIGKVEGYIKVPAIEQNGEVIPDMRYAGIIKRGAKLKSKSGQVFETIADIDFGEVDVTDPLSVQPADRNPTTNVPTSFALKIGEVDVKAGETKTYTVSVSEYKAFRKITLPDADVIEILSCVDSDGNDWYEVDFLAQDTVFVSSPNTGDDSAEVPYTLKLRSVPYRFISQYDIASNRTSLIFGSGDAQNFDGELIPNLGDLSLPLFGKDAFTGFFLDPQNFLKTRTLGLAPVDVTLTIRYRVGGGAATNVGTMEVDTVIEKTFDIGDSTLDSSVIKDVGNSFEVVNAMGPIVGGKDQLNLEEIRQLIPAHFAAQNRLVTAADFVARSLSMPAKFGSVFRANAKPSVFNKNAVELIILSRDSTGRVITAPNGLKSNLKTYLSQFRMMTDAIEILDGEIINIAVDFSVLTNPSSNKSEVVANCIDALKDFFNIEYWQINQPINRTDVITLLAAVPGVLSVVSLTFFNRVSNFQGREYSTTSHNLKKNFKNNIIYCGENKIFEVRYPNRDITGIAS